MCGRFAIDIQKPVFMRRFRVGQMELALAPHYNVAPGMYLPVIIRRSPNTVRLMKWGLVPNWSREPKTPFRTINARVESLESSAVYRMPFARQRCLIPAIGFYEWAQLSDNTKQPYFFRLRSREPFAFAGLWDSWRDAEGKEFPSCTIITCPANSVVGKIHPRMPVMLRESDEDTWLDVSSEVPNLKSLLGPYDSDEMEGVQVSLRVNNPRNDDASLIE